MFYRVAVVIFFTTTTVDVIHALTCNLSEPADVCYKDVVTPLNRLRVRLNTVPSFDRGGLPYDRIECLIGKVEDINVDLSRLETAQNELERAQDTANDVSSRLKDLNEIIIVLRRTLEAYERLNDKIREREKTINECDTANGDFQKLKDDTEKMQEIGKRIEAILDGKREQITKAKEHSSLVRNKLDELLSDEFLFKRYFCNANLKNALEGTINLLRQLAQYSNDCMKELLVKLKNDNKDIQHILVMLSDIPKVQEIDLDKTNKQIDDLFVKIEKILFTFDDALEKYRGLTDKILNQYKGIFYERVRKIRAEIDNGKRIPGIVKERQEMEADFENIKTIVRQLYSTGTCDVIQPGPNLET